MILTIYIIGCVAALIVMAGLDGWKPKAGWLMYIAGALLSWITVIFIWGVIHNVTNKDDNEKTPFSD